MKTSYHQYRILALILGVFGLNWATWTAASAPVVFLVDPEQSRIQITGDVVGNTFEEQGPGSLATSYSGSINAELTASTIQFTGSSMIDARTNGVWEPGPGGMPGSAPADYGAQAQSFLGTAKGALRNILLDLTSPTLTIANGQFDSQGLHFSIPTNSNAAFDFDVGFLGNGSRSLAGDATNRTVSGASVASTLSGHVLTILIDAEFRYDVLADEDSSVRLRGQLVARTAAASEARFTSISVSNQTVRLVAEGATAQAQLQSSADLRTWSPRTAATTNQNGRAVFTTTAMGAAEFFRLQQ